MKPELILAMAVLMIARPSASQEVVPSAQPGEVERQTVQKEKQPAEETGQSNEKKRKSEKESSAQQSGTSGAKKSDNDWGFRWSDHPSLRLGEGTQVDFRLRLQGDLHDSEASLPSDDGDGSDVDIARRRIGIDGEILNLFDYQVERELGENQDPWRDVYLNYKQFDFAEVQAGRFKLPFSLDENTSPTNLDFVYRSRIAALLAPGRDQGAMLHGRVLPRGVLRYELGLFKADGSNARTNNAERVHGDRTVAGRVLVQPFRSTKSVASDLAVGVAFTTSDIPEGIPDLRGRTELDAWFYRPEALVQGTRRRFGIEARWRPGPFSIKSEYIRLTDERLGAGVEEADLSPFLGSGWYVSGTWVVTGEQKADGLSAPRRPLFQGPFLDGWFGAVELGMRVERIRFGSVSEEGLPSTGPRAEVILGNSDRVYTFGVNWYANRWIKIQANLVRNAIAFPDQGPLPTQSAYWSRIVRFQFSM
jgi:phosphate-selective porin